MADKFYTAVKFAKEMGVAYPTMVRWLKRGLVSGAIAQETPMGRVWQIPESAKTMIRPKPGPKKTTDNKSSDEEKLIEQAIPKVSKKAGKKGAKK